MKKLRTSRRMMALVIVPGTVSSVMLTFMLWAVVQFHIAIAVAIALGLIAIICGGMYFVSDKGISFDEEKFVVKGGGQYYYHEIDAVIVKNSEMDLRRYKAIIVDGEEVCYFDDLYSNAKEFIAILERHGFTVKSDNRILD
ncbi:MAG: hypothetical protein E7544_00825 [Ruminococcaceae bacterium]|nr:hypothetical protein [Oscillospiraceae bacterium]